MQHFSEGNRATQAVGIERIATQLVSRRMVFFIEWSSDNGISILQ
jgi:hypothetical protein